MISVEEVDFWIQCRLAVVGVYRIHVVHVVDARHLLLDRGSHGLFDGQCVSAGIVAVDLYFRRYNVGKLGNRLACLKVSVCQSRIETTVSK